MIKKMRISCAGSAIVLLLLIIATNSIAESSETGPSSKTPDDGGEKEEYKSEANGCNDMQDTDPDCQFSTYASQEDYPGYGNGPSQRDVSDDDYDGMVATGDKRRLRFVKRRLRFIKKDRDGISYSPSPENKRRLRFIKKDAEEYSGENKRRLRFVKRRLRFHKKSQDNGLPYGDFYSTTYLPSEKFKRNDYNEDYRRGLPETILSVTPDVMNGEPKVYSSHKLNRRSIDDLVKLGLAATPSKRQLSINQPMRLINNQLWREEQRKLREQLRKFLEVGKKRSSMASSDDLALKEAVLALLNA